jgi:hypothetical protein
MLLSAYLFAPLTGCSPSKEDDTSDGDTDTDTDSDTDTDTDSDTDTDTDSDTDTDTDTDVGCKDGETHERESFEYTFCPHAAERADADAVCAKAGWQLVYVSDAAENGWLLDTADAQPTFDSNDDEALRWIGLNDIDKDGTWVWDDGSTPKYTNWSPGAKDEDPERDCATLVVDTSNPKNTPNGSWHPKGCDSPYAYVCKRP